MRQFGRLILKRLLIIPISLFIVVTLSFGLIELLPGDPAVAILGDFATEENLAAVRAELRLDQPLHRRYALYVSDVLRGDLGTSFVSRRPVRTEIATYLPNTIELVALSLLLATLLGLVLGIAGAYYRRRTPDSGVRWTFTLLQSVPPFLLALLLIFVAFFLWRIAPAPVGRVSIQAGAGTRTTGFLLFDTLLVQRDWTAFISALQHMALPVLTLGLVYSAYIGKTTRATMMNALGSAQVQFARACGLPQWQVLRYAFLQARTPILTYGMILFGALVGGAAIVEIVFSWRGVGEWAIRAMLNLDAPAIQGFIIAAGAITLFVYVVLDVAVKLLDPRVSYD